MTKKLEKKDKKDQTSPTVSQDFLNIVEGLKNNPKFITDVLKSRIMPGDYRFHSALFDLKGEEEPVGMIFTVTSGKKDTYVLIDISVPHLQIGQKYTLPAKARLFHKQEKAPLNRIKKAIVLVRKGTETISARPSRIRCPIIEVPLEKTTASNKPRAANQKTGNQPKAGEPEKKQGAKPVSPELLYALKEAIVHECLSTMHKRRNKYIRKGLWRWIEREILDPNVHFYLIILSSIYQGKTGDILSRRFRTVEDYSNRIDDIISAIFSKETNLADEIKKNFERHKKALKKFLACFAQTPPFEYLKNLFLKEFRTSQDGLKARLSVFTTLNQLLERCGFEGEKETQYPLEILDELGIFQGIMTGNYQQLRIINASKKLKHLVPQVEWGEDEIYLLRDQLARALNLPAQEFNLNAFLPQAFVQDAQKLAEARKEAFRVNAKNANSNSRSEHKNDQQIEKPVTESKATPATTQPANDEKQTQHTEKAVSSDNKPQRERRPMQECDESKHRHFEFFGGVIEEDIDAVRLALALSRYEAEKEAMQKAKELETSAEADALLEEDTHPQPRKTTVNKAYAANFVPPKRKTSIQSNNNKSRRRRPNNRNSQNNRNKRTGNRRNNNNNKI